jgi:hypothetical protein
MGEEPHGKVDQVVLGRHPMDNEAMTCSTLLIFNHIAYKISNTSLHLRAAPVPLLEVEYTTDESVWSVKVVSDDSLMSRLGL